MTYTSYDVDLQSHVPFRAGIDRIYIHEFIESNPQKKIYFGGMNRHFQAKHDKY